jgi:RNA polymerase sigma-70 factor (sigma-E family)
MDLELVMGEGGGRLDDLYAQHIDDAVRLAYLLTGDRALAEDLAHDAFVRVGGRLRLLSGSHAFVSYLRTTIVNLTRDHHRRTKRQKDRLHNIAELERPVSLPDIEERDVMWTALQKLSARRRAALVLRYYQDLPEREIAEALGCSLSGAKSLVRRGLASLRQEMEVLAGE